MKPLFPIITALLFIAAPFAQSRDWSFSKDRVYEAALIDATPKVDMVFLKNQITDTLKFDSVAVEVLTLGKSRMEVLFYKPHTPFAQTYQLTYSGGRTSYEHTSVKSITVSPADSIQFFEFHIDWKVHPVPEEIVPGSDTIFARLIFIAANGRGRDTLMVGGIEENKPVSLRSLRSTGALPTGTGNRSFDPLGRRADDLSAPGRIPATPLLSPKE